MDTVNFNSKSSKTSQTYRLLLNLTNKIDLQKGEKVLHYQISNLSIVSTTRGKI